VSTLPLFAPGAVEQDDDKSRDAWATPRLLGRNLVEEFGCRLDVAASHSTALCSRYFTAADDGLSRPWDVTVWCNPPYSDPSPWVKRAIMEADRGRDSVLLLPAMVGVAWFTRASMYARWWTFDKRIEFIPPEGIKASKSNIGNVLFHFHVYAARGWGGVRSAYDGSIVFNTEG